MATEVLALLKTLSIWLATAIGAIDLIGILVMVLERYGGMKGRIFYMISHFLPKAVFGPLPKSLASLRDWHDPEKREALMQAYGQNQERDLIDKHPFSQWMVAEMVHSYENNVQGIAYLGAAVLIFVIGLRGIQVLTKEDTAFIIVALLLEFTLIGVLGLMLFYKPEESKYGGMDLTIISKLQRLEEELVEKDTALRTLRTDVDASIRRLQTDLDALRRAGEAPKGKGSA
jgi:hypothetical protein